MLSIIGFSILVIGITIFMTLKNTSDLIKILEENIKTGLITTSVAARGLLDVDAFDSYNSIDDVTRDREAYDKTLESLRVLRKQAGVTYIYALKLVDGGYHFIFDTDEEMDTLFLEYELSHVHERAFLGEDSADITNVVDEYGSFNTGAVPIWKDGKIIGIVSTDIEDEYIQESRVASQRNAILLIIVLVVTMGAMVVIVSFLMRNAREMRDKLFRMANYDVLTGLPNRQYLLTYLDELSNKALLHGDSYAFLLIDLDNFKQVNDGAGHDAGDNLLRDIGEYLDNIHVNSRAFRPPAGALNVSARIGGDEFVQVIPGIGTIESAREIAQKMIDNFSSQKTGPFIEKYKVGLSVGIALFPFHTDDYNELIKYADVAMYNAKSSGKNTYSVYSEEMSQTEPTDQPDGHLDRRQYRH